MAMMFLSNSLLSNADEMFLHQTDKYAVYCDLALSFGPDYDYDVLWHSLAFILVPPFELDECDEDFDVSPTETSWEYY